MFPVFSLIVRLVSLLPARVLMWLSYPLAGLTWCMSSTKRNSTYLNLEACYPGISREAHRRIAFGSMRHYVMVALETGMSWYWPSSRLDACFEAPVGWDHVESAHRQGRGVLFLVPHFGTWELLNLWLCRQVELASLYKPGRYPDFDEKLLRKRKRLGGELVPTSRSGIKVLVQYLKSGRNVLILPDQDPSEGQGRFVPFFGVPAHTPVLASRLCRQTDCVALMAVCERRPGGRYRPHILPVEAAFHDPDIDESLAAMNRGVEQCIALDPAQYLWAYKRFKSRPEGEGPFYRRN